MGVNMDSNLAPFDAKIPVSMKVLGLYTIEFQFPPKISHETNSSSWRETDILAIELLRIFRGSVGRRITVEWEYIASGSVWTGSRIASNLRFLKSYFFEFKFQQYPVVQFKYTLIVPEPMNFRLRDLNINYGPELVNGYYPLYTKVVATLELATRVSSPESPEDLPKVNVPPLQEVQSMWY